MTGLGSFINCLTDEGVIESEQLKNIISQSQLCNVYYALIEIHLRYADVIWGSLIRNKDSCSSTPSRSSVFNNN